MSISLGTGQFTGRSKLLLAGALVLLAGWFAWNALNQWRAEQAAGQLQVARDAVVSGTADAVRRHQQEMARQLELPAVKAAAAAGDPAAFELAFRDGMRDVEDVKVYPADLAQAYADPAAFGWSRLALLEQAVLDGKAAVRVVKDAGAARLGVAAWWRQRSGCSLCGGQRARSARWRGAGRARLGRLLATADGAARRGLGGASPRLERRRTGAARCGGTGGDR